MPLVEVNVSVEEAVLPGDVRAFLREAGRRVRRCQRDGRLPAFVPSDYPGAYHLLRALDAADLAAGNIFCEWGSGLGVVAGLASLLGFSSYGVEVEGELVEAAEGLADHFGLPVTFFHNSFIPAAYRGLLPEGEYAWLVTSRPSAEEDIAPDEADVIYAYPWPDEEHLVADVFRRYARAGALLVTYHDNGGLRVRRKVRG